MWDLTDIRNNNNNNKIHETYKERDTRYKIRAYETRDTGHGARHDARNRQKKNKRYNMIQNSNQKKRNNTTHLLKRSHDLEGKSICSLPQQSIAKLPRCHVTLQLDGVPGRGKGEKEWNFYLLDPTTRYEIRRYL